MSVNDWSGVYMNDMTIIWVISKSITVVMTEVINHHLLYSLRATAHDLQSGQIIKCRQCKE